MLSADCVLFYFHCFALLLKILSTLFLIKFPDLFITGTILSAHGIFLHFQLSVDILDLQDVVFFPRDDKKLYVALLSFYYLCDSIKLGNNVWTGYYF